MKEFIFYIRNERDEKKSFSEEQHLAFIKKCELYIGELKNQNKLIAAQPIVCEGVFLKKAEMGWSETDIDKDNETHVGYYHILANDILEAIEIAKENPEFEFVTSATIEVRPIKTIELKTGFVYPVEK